MIRYHFDATWSGETLHENDFMVPWKNGDWIKYKDHETEVEQLQKEADVEFVNEAHRALARADKAEAKAEAKAGELELRHRQINELRDELAIAEAEIARLTKLGG